MNSIGDACHAITWYQIKNQVCEIAYNYVTLVIKVRGEPPNTENKFNFGKPATVVELEMNTLLCVYLMIIIL